MIGSILFSSHLFPSNVPGWLDDAVDVRHLGLLDGSLLGFLRHSDVGRERLQSVFLLFLASLK